MKSETEIRERIALLSHEYDLHFKVGKQATHHWEIESAVTACRRLSVQMNTLRWALGEAGSPQKDQDLPETVKGKSG
jgi:hypothetical protein